MDSKGSEGIYSSRASEETKVGFGYEAEAITGVSLREDFNDFFIYLFFILHPPSVNFNKQQIN